jgi:predicted RNase H-like HicB family nuclease
MKGAFIMYNEIFRYPAIITREEDGQFSIEFPDLNCATCAETEERAGISAKELLAIELSGLIEDGETIPLPSPIAQIKLNLNDKAVMVDVVLPKTDIANYKVQTTNYNIQNLL